MNPITLPSSEADLTLVSDSNRPSCSRSRVSLASDRRLSVFSGTTMVRRSLSTVTERYFAMRQSSALLTRVINHRIVRADPSYRRYFSAWRMSPSSSCRIQAVYELTSGQTTSKLGGAILTKPSSLGTCPSPTVSHASSMPFAIRRSQDTLLIRPELAHNLESAHNSRHEFHFSSIAEMYLVKLSALIRQ